MTRSVRPKSAGALQQPLRILGIIGLDRMHALPIAVVCADRIVADDFGRFFFAGFVLRMKATGFDGALNETRRHGIRMTERQIDFSQFIISRPSCSIRS